MISKIREKLNLLDLIVDSAEDNDGFSNLDRQAALDTVRCIYDIILTAPMVSVGSPTEKSDIEVSVYGISEVEGVEVEIEKYETRSLNSECEFEIENKLTTEFLDSDDEDGENEFFGDIKEDIEEEDFELNSDDVVEKHDDDSEVINEEPIEELEIESDLDSSEEFESLKTSNSGVSVVVGEILNLQSDADFVFEQPELYSAKKEDEIVYAGEQELLFDETDLLFSEEQKSIVVDDLFNGDVSKCDDFIKKISLFTDFDEAIIYLQEHFSDSNSERALEIVAEKLTDKLM